MLHFLKHIAPQLIVVGVFFVCAIYVHFRGKVRHKFVRQLTDHSTFMAPYNALIYLFSAVPNKPILDEVNFPDLKPLRENWELIRDEAMRLYEAGHIQSSSKHNDLAFNTFFKRGWKRFYLKWYDEIHAVGEGDLPKDGRAGAVDSVGACGVVCAAAAQEQAGGASRSICRLAPLSPGPDDAEFR